VLHQTGSNQKVISLLPSATEIVCALGARERLVGRSHECDYPGGLDQLPACTAPKFDIHGSSGEIDRQVKSILENVLAVYKVDAEGLRALKRDAIVTQSQCDVCAVSETDLRELVDAWLEGAPELVLLEPNRMDDVYRDFQRVGTALDEEAKSAALVERIRDAIGVISTTTKIWMSGRRLPRSNGWIR
jgi:iron complex transport system substrate-binding protein